MILHGKDLKIATQNNGVLVAGAKSCEINVECDELEISSPDTGQWRDFIAGRKSWMITMNYLVQVGSVATDVLKVGTTVNIKVLDGSTGAQLEGTAIVRTYRSTGTLGNLTQGSFVFRGKGALAPPSNN